MSMLDKTNDSTNSSDLVVERESSYDSSIEVDSSRVSSGSEAEESESTSFSVSDEAEAEPRRSRFAPRRNFVTPKTINAEESNVKNLTLYPNADSRVSQYVTLNLPTYEESADRTRMFRTNVVFEDYPKNLDFRFIQLDLDDGFVVSKNFNSGGPSTLERKRQLIKNNVGREITLEYLESGPERKVARSYSGTLVQYTEKGDTYYIRTNFMTGEGSDQIRALRRPDQVTYTCTRNEVESVEELNPTDLRDIPASVNLQVQHHVPRDSRDDNSCYGLFHYNVGNITWDMYSSVIISDSKEDLLESFTIYADLTNKSGKDFKNIENIKFVLNKIKTVNRPSVAPRTNKPTNVPKSTYSVIGGGQNNTVVCAYSAITSGAYNTVMGGGASNYIQCDSNGNRSFVGGGMQNTISESECLLIEEESLASNGQVVACRSVAATQDADAGDRLYQSGQKHVGGVGTFTVYDVTDLPKDSTTSVLFLRDVNIPFTRIFDITLQRNQSTLSKERLPMQIRISTEQHRRLSSFMPASHVSIKARHPDQGLIHLADTEYCHRYHDGSLYLDAGLCDEVRLSDRVTTEKHTEEYEHRTQTSERRFNVEVRSRTTKLDHIHHLELSNNSVRDIEVALNLDSDLAPHGFDDQNKAVPLEELDYVRVESPSYGRHRLLVSVQSSSVRNFKLAVFTKYNY